MKFIFKNWGRGLSGAGLALVLTAGAGCENGSGPMVVSEDPTNNPMRGLTHDELAMFNRGDALIEKVFRETEGLGPLFIEASCATCHSKDSRGPGKVERMAIANADGTTGPDQSALPFGTVVRRHMAAGATDPILPPMAANGLLLSTRFGPALFARGRMEAVPDQQLRDEAARQAAAGRVSGHPNELADGSLGRFGVKGRVSSLDVFTADAFHGDMGLTSSRFPDEFPNPDKLTDDLRPGLDVTDETVADIAHYIRTLAMPRREGLTDTGADLLRDTGCTDCHVNTYKTRTDHPIAVLAGIDADVYTDLLLHDLGTANADGITDVTASGREWKTAPLVGLRFFKTFMHDGRARTLDAAVRAHAGEGSEANDAVARYEALDETTREALLDHLGKL